MVSDEVLSRFNVSEENRVRIKKVADYNYSFLTNAFNDDLIRSGRPYSVEQFRLVRSTRMFLDLRERLIAMVHRLSSSGLRQAELQVILIQASLIHQHTKPMMRLGLLGSWSSK